MKSGSQPTARRSERICVQMPVTLHVDSTALSEEHAVSTVDLSSNGVRIRTNARLLPGLAVAIVTNSGQPCTLPGRVVWTSQVGTRLEAQAGIEFLKPVIAPV